ncbi:serpin-ZXA-like [Phoenix dactylifera]|uniref:Serpin-ZXA-like n=1 Tax=Phoenix dactylifera TaxID=42345 RepID=A0A8B8ZEH0_PHODC|nr:serpin-ZXA-like [Phoenix dactylifera]
MDLRESIGNQTAFSLQLAKHVGSAAAPDANVAFSPLSVHIVLALVAAGAKGPTLDQLLSFLRSPAAGDLNALSSQIVALVLADGSAAGGPRVCFANGVWVDASLSLKPSFKELVTSTYKAEAKAVDFQAKAAEVANEVNSWVESVTAGLIKELLPSGSVDSTTRLVLGNALYFKGAWDEKFDASSTKDSAFHLLNGSSVQVPFMTSKKTQFVSAHNGFKVLRLPYEQGEDRRQFSMYIFLPDAQDGLWSLAEKLSSESDFLNLHLPTQKVKLGDFKLPRFKISFGFEASEVLKDLGLALPFSGNGDLTEMVDSPVGHKLSVSSVFHKAFIEVTEEGTEAAAATAAVLMKCSAVRNPLDFVADHPFLFLIREDITGVVLFVGHVINPLLAG